MLVKPTIDELLPKTENRYTLAVLVAKRARQLVDGAKPMINSASPNLVTMASEEVAASAVVGVPGLHEPKVPLRPEVEAARLAAAAEAENSIDMDNIRGELPGRQAEPAAHEGGVRSLLKFLNDNGDVYDTEDELKMDQSEDEDEDDFDLDPSALEADEAEVDPDILKDIPSDDMTDPDDESGSDFDPTVDHLVDNARDDSEDLL
ncbi:MAG: DNA-directed RNA polymerase subunit omega [Oscillospiraceae bacterium]|nr:DNA-directed RNA polymerase subunit omega [Oscillospiraceae bacterium]MDD4368322.1 DNA-directed RNA polymerase subunit omega [Oscillospiraceae bacterium]